MLLVLAGESKALMDNLKTKVMMGKYTPIYVNTIQIEKIEAYTIRDINRETKPETKPRPGDSKKTHCQLDNIQQVSQHQG